MKMLQMIIASQKWKVQLKNHVHSKKKKKEDNKSTTIFKA